MPLRQMTVGVTVTARPPEETGASTSDSASSRLLDGGPVADEFQALLPLLPGVVRSGDGRIQMKGGAATQGGLQVSGASVNDPSTGDFAFTMPSEAVESVDLLPNPFAAEFGHFSTGVVRVQTRRGGCRT
jgi:outer membrane receptor protein involved in Fe transport